MAKKQSLVTSESLMRTKCATEFPAQNQYVAEKGWAGSTASVVSVPLDPGSAASEVYVPLDRGIYGFGGKCHTYQTCRHHRLQCTKLADQ